MTREIRYPENESQVIEAIKASLEVRHKSPSRQDLGTWEVIGGGSKRGYGHAGAGQGVLCLSRLSGIELYQPEELVMTARAGTPLQDIEQALTERNQQLGFEPPTWQRVFATNAAPTIGGVFACNLSGPRRFLAGAARDVLLGVRAISGRGEAFKSGGRVIKNVTGYDMGKLMCGSMGTLAVMTEVTFKTQPRPQRTITLAITGLTATGACGVLTAAARGPWGMTGGMYVPAKTASRLDQAEGAPYGAQGDEAVVFVRLEGFYKSVAERGALLAEAVIPSKARTRILDDEASTALWAALRELAPFCADPARDLWRLRIAPTKASGVLDQLDAMGGVSLLDQAGGLIWWEPPASLGRTALPDLAGGQATLVRSVGDDIARFHPVPVAQQALQQRIKQAFDPLGILGPGRMGVTAYGV
ncbi:MAG: FAD-binding protein [Pseudomonadota bacterium]